jgi:hypothetical protein
MNPKMKRWLFVLAIITVILIACIIQIRGFNPFRSN